MPFIPHTEEDIQHLLKALNITSSEVLFDEIPESMRCQDFTNIPQGISEMAMLQEAEYLSAQNNNGICFIGAGSYDHFIPAAVWDIASRGEFLTAYTPYQAEASQGTLQLLYEFQTMIATLTAMEVANASLYDGASALAEAILMAVRIKKNTANDRILILGTLHPFYRQTVETIIRNQQIEIITVPFDEATGIVNPNALEAYAHLPITALVVSQPNFFGCLERVDALCDWASKHEILTIACVNPLSLALLKPPGEWGEKGADIVCGEGQPLGVPMASGGPYFGFLSTRMCFVRQLPGRLIGQTVDKEGKRGFTLTLQAREQHIRRGKANSNICTNQGLLVTAATIYMSLLGAEGLKAAALKSHANTLYLKEKLCAIPGIRAHFSAPFFHEMVLHCDKPVEPLLAYLLKHHIQGGYALEKHFHQCQQTLLVCATEMRTPAEIDYYAEQLRFFMEHKD